MVLEGRDKKGGSLEANSSEYSVSKSKMQVVFYPGFVGHRTK